jgi:hypothetical protein
MKCPPALSIVAFLLLLGWICACGSRSDILPAVGPGYIKGYFGDEYLHFQETHKRIGIHDTFSNVYISGPNMKHTRLIRNDTDPAGRSIQIFIHGVDIDSVAFPFSFDNPQNIYISAEIQLRDFRTGQTQAFSFTDQVNYVGTSYQSMRVVITGLQHEVVSGTFEGTIRTASGLSMPVRNGEFRIPLLRMRQ